MFRGQIPDTLVHTVVGTPTRAWSTWAPGSTFMSKVRWWRWSYSLNLEVRTNLQKTHRSFAASLTDPADPSTVFVTPRNSPRVKEGQDFLYRCLLTDPSVTNLTFQPEDNIQGSGQHLPVGMNVTVDPQRGALIQDVQRSFSGQYVCSGWKDGRHFISRSFHLLVAPSKTCHSLFWPECLLASLFAGLCLIVVLIAYPMSSYADNLTKAVWLKQLKSW